MKRLLIILLMILIVSCSKREPLYQADIYVTNKDCKHMYVYKNVQYNNIVVRVTRNHKFVRFKVGDNKETIIPVPKNYNYYIYHVKQLKN